MTSDLDGKSLLGTVQDGRVDLRPHKGGHAVQLRLDFHDPRLTISKHKQDRGSDRN